MTEKIAGTSSFSLRMYSHTSISVQFESGNTAHIFTRIDTGVVEIPDFRALIFRVPLAKAVAETEESLLGAGFFLVAPRTADAAVEAELLDGRQQRGNLQTIAADFTR